MHEFSILLYLYTLLTSSSSTAYAYARLVTYVEAWPGRVDNKQRASIIESTTSFTHEPIRHARRTSCTLLFHRRRFNSVPGPRSWWCWDRRRERLGLGEVKECTPRDRCPWNDAVGNGYWTASIWLLTNFSSLLTVPILISALQDLAQRIALLGDLSQCATKLEDVGERALDRFRNEPSTTSVHIVVEPRPVGEFRCLLVLSCLIRCASAKITPSVWGKSNLSQAPPWLHEIHANLWGWRDLVGQIFCKANLTETDFAT